MADFKITEIKRNQIPLYRRQLGIVFQDFKLLKTKTVLENTMMPLLATGLNPQKAEQQSQATLKTLGLSERVHLFPQQLSGGEQQKVSLARALVHRPRIILADEPTGNLDPQSALEVKKILEGLCHSGTTVLVITHDERWVQESNYRNLKLENGEILNP